MEIDLIEIPTDLYRALIREHLYHQLPEGPEDERMELVEEYVEMAKERYWENE